MAPNMSRMPIAGEPLSVVLLVHNQEGEIDQILASWTEYLQTLPQAHELLVVDTGSSDATAEKVENFALGHPSARLLTSAAGAGNAFRRALRETLHPLLLLVAQSDAIAPRETDKFLRAIDHVDLVSADRGRAGRRETGFWYRWFVHFVFGVRVHDVDSPVKMFRRTIFDRIPIQSQGSFVHAEIIAKANFLGCLILDVPIGQARSGRNARLLADPWSRWREAHILFHQPDFGPVSTTAEPEWPAPEAVPLDADRQVS